MLMMMLFVVDGIVVLFLRWPVQFRQSITCSQMSETKEMNKLSIVV